jgi:hypothetical protein
MVLLSQSLVEALLALHRFMFRLLPMFLNLPCSSGGQIVDSSCSVTLDFDSCFVQDRLTGTLLGAGPSAVMVSEGLTGFVFPSPPPRPASRHLLSSLLALSSSGIIVLDIYVVLISHL